MINKEPIGQNYRIFITVLGEEAIECLTCGRVSYNPNDIKNKYCGNCKRFHEQP